MSSLAYTTKRKKETTLSVEHTWSVKALISSAGREARGRLEGVARLGTSRRPGAFSLVSWLDSYKERASSGGGVVVSGSR
ncbi:hypothetical protein BHM03_00057448, partial [Ensete ventricosum]